MKKRNICRIMMIFLGIVLTLGIFGATVQADFMGSAHNWYKKGGTVITLDLQELVNLINIAGTSIIAIVTVILGIKYMLGSATGKAEVKDQMITLLVACIFFFGWSNLSGLLINGAVFNTTTGTYDNVGAGTQLFVFDGTADIGTMFAKIFAVVMFFARIIAVVVTMIIGLRYIFGGADTKSQIKQRGPMYIIGILLIFCTIGILSFVSDAIIGGLG